MNDTEFSDGTYLELGTQGKNDVVINSHQHVTTTASSDGDSDTIKELHYPEGIVKTVGVNVHASDARSGVSEKE